MSSVMQHCQLQGLDTRSLWGCDGSVYLLRLDLLDHDMPGNKFYKLGPNIDYALRQRYQGLLSFGGQHSNHIHALAAAGRRFGLDTIGIIRADNEQEPQQLSPTLQDARDMGMQLRFVTRGEYRRRHDSDYLSELGQRYPTFLLLPEGGSNLRGVAACGDIVSRVEQLSGGDYELLVLPCGTGGTLAGIASALPTGKHVLGVAVLRGEKFLARDIENWLQQLGAGQQAAGCVGRDNWRLDFSYYGAGYACSNEVLDAFCANFFAATGVPLEPVYSGKMLYAVSELLKSGRIAANQKVIAIHTGGLQGARQRQRGRETICVSAPLTECEKVDE